MSGNYNAQPSDRNDIDSHEAIAGLRDVSKSFGMSRPQHCLNVRSIDFSTLLINYESGRSP